MISYMVFASVQRYDIAVYNNLVTLQHNCSIRGQDQHGSAADNLEGLPDGEQFCRSDCFQRSSSNRNGVRSSNSKGVRSSNSGYFCRTNSRYICSHDSFYFSPADHFI